MNKHILSILLLNIAFICIFSIFVEYNSVDDKVSSVNTAVSSSVDSAVQLALTSEELFGLRWDDTDNEVTSDVQDVATGEANGDSADLTRPKNGKEFEGVKVTYYSNGWKTGELYNLSKDFDMSTNRFPASVGSSLNSSDKVYDWLYTSTKFEDFYNNIGNKVETSVYAKTATTSDYSTSAYDLERKTIPVLSQMGVLGEEINDSDTSTAFLDAKKVGKRLMFNAGAISNSVDDYTDDTAPEFIGSDVTNDAIDDVDTDDNSAYYLTPTSLGVTYLDERVLKTLIVAHLQTTLRSQKGDAESTETDSIKSCVGRIPLNVYFNGHRYEPSFDASNTFNNGKAEFDLSSLDVKVDYALVDAYSSGSDELMALLEGATVGSTGSHGTANRLKGNDTINNDTRNNSTYSKRIVAKITVGVDINIPYSTPVMQYFRWLGRTDDTDRLGIRPLGNNSKGKDNPTVLRYNYITYASVNR